MRVLSPRWLTLLPVFAICGPSSAQVPGPGSVPVQLPTLADLNVPEPPARIPIFFPLAPPAPREGIERLTHLQQAGYDAPEGLAPYVGEVFYTPLATCLAEKHLPAKRLSRLEAYRAERDALVARLRAGPITADDAARCARLEAAADELRRACLVDNHEWGRYRMWNVAAHEADAPEPVRRNREFAVLRAAPAYDEALNPAQRRLLADFVTLLSFNTQPSANLPPPPVAPGGLASFFPEGAWLSVPADVPAPLLAEIAALAQAKFQLQRELALAVIANDRGPSRKRQAALAAHAARMEPALAGLERQAERIRVALAALPVAGPPPLPPDVAAQVAQLRAERAAIQREFGERLRAVRAKACRYAPGAETLYWRTNFTPGGTISVTPGRPPDIQLGGELAETPPQTQRLAGQQRLLDEAAKKFLAGTATRQRRLETMRAELLAAMIRALAPEQSPERPAAPEAPKQAWAILRLHELAARDALYAPYLAAALRPGLEPAVRRVLFAAALRDLDLPLPAGVRRPVGVHNGP